MKIVIKVLAFALYIPTFLYGAYLFVVVGGFVDKVYAVLIAYALAMTTLALVRVLGW